MNEPSSARAGSSPPTGRNLRETFDREQARSRARIALLVVPLTLLHVGFFAAILLVLVLMVGAPALIALLMDPSWLAAFLSVPALATLLHMLLARRWVMDRLHRRIPVEANDPFDGRYRRLLNIVDELSIAAGIPVPEIHVVPSVAINAFALEALGKRRLYVTQGAVSLLDRDELQGVVAHVLAHLASGDIAVGTHMLALVNAIGFTADLSSREHLEVSVDVPRGFLGLMLLSLTSFLAALAAGALCSVISRDRKYLADQLAVEVTRHPEALAAALWKMQLGTRVRLSVAFDEIGLVCVVPPLYRVLDRSSGWFGSVFSVHPPVTERIRRLSRYPLDVLESRLRDAETAIAAAAPPLPASRFLAWDGDAWQGPFLFAELAALGWLTPQTWIHASDSGTTDLMSQSPWFRRWLRRRAGHEPSPRRCALCGGGLAYDYLEETRLERCGSCGAVTLDRDRIRKIRLRRSRSVLPDPIPEPVRDDSGRPDLTCPRCAVRTARKFFSCERPIVIDECPRCRLVTLDPGELDILIARGS